MEELPLEEYDARVLIADRDRYVAAVISQVSKSIERRLGVACHLRWSYDSKQDVCIKVGWNPGIVETAHPDWCNSVAIEAWQKAQAQWPEVLFGQKHSDFTKHHHTTSTVFLSTDDFIEAMKARRGQRG